MSIIGIANKTKHDLTEPCLRCVHRSPLSLSLPLSLFLQIAIIKDRMLNEERARQMNEIQLGVSAAHLLCCPVLLGSTCCAVLCCAVLLSTPLQYILCDGCSGIADIVLHCMLYCPPRRVHLASPHPSSWKELLGMLEGQCTTPLHRSTQYILTHCNSHTKLTLIQRLPSPLTPPGARGNDRACVLEGRTWGLPDSPRSCATGTVGKYIIAIQFD